LVGAKGVNVCCLTSAHPSQQVNASRDVAPALLSSVHVTNGSENVAEAVLICLGESGESKTPATLRGWRSSNSYEKWTRPKVSPNLKQFS
jgi:hypothetical protein